MEGLKLCAGCSRPAQPEPSALCHCRWRPSAGRRFTGLRRPCGSKDVARCLVEARRAVSCLPSSLSAWDAPWGLAPVPMFLCIPLPQQRVRRGREPGRGLPHGDVCADPRDAGPRGQAAHDCHGTQKVRDPSMRGGVGRVALRAPRAHHPPLFSVCPATWALQGPGQSWRQGLRCVTAGTLLPRVPPLKRQCGRSVRSCCFNARFSRKHHRTVTSGLASRVQVLPVSLGRLFQVPCPRPPAGRAAASCSALCSSSVRHISLSVCVRFVSDKCLLKGHMQRLEAQFKPLYCDD